jgi:hypothetical protein
LAKKGKKILVEKCGLIVVIKTLVAMKQSRLICCEALMKAVKSSSKEKTMATVKVKEKIE